MIELSVVIPTYGKVGQLRPCLEALCCQTQLATDFEVIAVTDESTDVTSKVFANLTAPYKLQVMQQRNSGRWNAVNSAVEAAVGRYCLLLMDDIIAHPKLVAEHLRVQRQHERVVGVGQIILKLPHRADAYARDHALERRDHYARLNHGRLPSFVDCYWGNLSVSRAAFLEVGGFALDVSSGEDTELGYRFERQGFSFVYIPEAIAYQDYRKGFGEIAADAERAGLVSIELSTRHPAMLPLLQLGAFYDMSRTAILLRRLLLILGVPSHLLAIAGLMLGKRSWARQRYRFVYSYCYWRGVRRAVPDRDTWQRLTRSPVVLMYHALGRPGEPPSRYVLPRRRFALQMAWLKWRGYHVLSLEEFLRDRTEYRLSPSRSVILTFDDGYADNGTLAYPVLRRYGFPATIFLVSEMMGGTNSWDREGELVDRPLLSWSDVQEMLQGDIRFGAHTRRHVPLTLVSLSRVKEEVEGSQADLERRLGIPIFAFAYPNGEFNPVIQKVVERAGFLGACSCHPGVNDPVVACHALRRVEVRGTDSFVHFVLALWLGISARSHSYGSGSCHVDLGPSRDAELHEEATSITRSGRQV